MRVIVQKFGGTSVATMESRRLIAARVSEAMGEGFSPVIVVSAMGRAGDPYSTDTLIALAKSEYTSSDARE
ncbi:MAG: aspartate kinase, partial [Bacillota bacterium]|nr:aspartate kinase [Bacillota bacterium]